MVKLRASTTGKHVDVRSLISGSRRLTSELSAVVDDNPIGFRRWLQDAYQVAVDGCGLSGIAHLALLFGSAGRGEASRDLDLLLVFDVAGRWREYERLEFHGHRVDLNVTSSSWLKSADRDIEWGYCLAESFVLGGNSPNLEQNWRDAVIRYSRPVARSERIRQHFRQWSQLSEARAECQKQHPLVARLLGGEAVRAAMSGIIEGFAQRVFSHRSFVDEFLQACSRSQTPVALSSAILKGIVGADTGRVAAESYLDMRTRVSGVYRSLRRRFGVTYNASDDRPRRLESLILLSQIKAVALLEGHLDLIEANEWLPRLENLDAADTAIGTIADDLHSFDPISWRTAEPRSATREPFAIPTRAGELGTRWVEYQGSQLKVILNTGGCKTPTCEFCHLPAYGRAFSQAGIMETLRTLLNAYDVVDLKLYNDGSILNPEEVSPNELTAVCALLKERQVNSFSIESIPRFVTEQTIQHVLSTSGVQELNVAMGFQLTGDWVANSVLGRPDPDALFDRTVDLLRRLGVRTRLYLMWGYPAVRSELWPSLLSASLQWAVAREVDHVTVCPYVLPIERLPTSEAATLCSLRRTIASFASSERTRVTVSLAQTPSCGVSYMGASCGPCTEALRTGRWSDGPVCPRASQV